MAEAVALVAMGGWMTALAWIWAKTGGLDQDQDQVQLELARLDDARAAARDAYRYGQGVSAMVDAIHSRALAGSDERMTAYVADLVDRMTERDEALTELVAALAEAGAIELNWQEDL